MDQNMSLASNKEIGTLIELEQKEKEMPFEALRLVRAIVGGRILNSTSYCILVHSPNVPHT
jgi:hypothetical protein